MILSKCLETPADLTPSEAPRAANGTPVPQPGNAGPVALAHATATPLSSATPRPVPTVAPPPLSEIERLAKSSNDAQKRFLAIAHADIALPANLQYVAFEIDDQAESLYGENRALGVGLLVTAHPQRATATDVVNFFRDHQKFMPNLIGKQIVGWENPIPLPTTPGVGIGTMTWWKARTNDGGEMHVVLLNRIDSKGSYLFVTTGPSSYFSENDEVFEKMFKTVRANPGL